MRIEPVDHPSGQSTDRIHNGDFEKGDEGWVTKKGNTMCRVVTDRAASGERSLKIVDESEESGSYRLSSRMLAKPGGTYAIRGNVFPVSGASGGLGVYARFYDGSDKIIASRAKSA